jgi:hypothetical protein
VTAGQTTVESTHAAPDNRRWARADGVLWREVATGVLLLAPNATEPLLLSGSGAAVWQVLAHPVGEDELVQVLADAFGVGPDVVGSDVRPLLCDLADRDIVQRLP